MFLHSSMEAGGAERTIATFANSMVELGHDVAITTRRISRDHYQLDHRVRRYRLSHANSSTKAGKDITRARSVIHRQFGLVRSTRDFRPDVTITFGINALGSSLLGRRWSPVGKIVYAERSNPYISHANNRRAALARILTRHADGLIFQTEGARGYFPRSAQLRGIIIENPINEEFSRIEHVSHDNRDACVVVLGRLAPVKRVDFILEVFEKFHALHPNYTLQVIGAGPEREKLEEAGRKIGDGSVVQFLGVQSDTREYLSRARFYILASAYEGMPNSLMEAMAAGLTCFAADCDFGPRSLIRSGVNGWLFPVKDGNELLQRMHEEASDLSHSTMMGSRARSVIESNSPARITNKVINYLEEVRWGSGR